MNLVMIRDRWRDIRAAIKQDIESGLLEAGAGLSTEPELAQRYSVGRHSIRRAIAELGKEGLLSVEQGRGTFVQSRPRLTYTIGPRTRMRSNMNALGVDVASEMLSVEHLQASDKIAAALAISSGAPIIATRRRSFADGVPVSFGTLFHDASRFADFPERREAMGSVSAVYASYGVADYKRANTKMHARSASTDEAQLLSQHPDMPVIVVQSIDAQMSGKPIAYTEVIWSAARVTFDIPNTENDT
jgi:GntR family phosphonate transport system transcriptional regulator